MAFTVTDFADLVHLLARHPEWQAELRRLTLSEDFLALPGIMRELAEAQRRTEQRVEELAEAQRRTEQRVEELAEAQRRTEQRVEELAEAQRRTEQRVGELAEAQRRTEQRVEELAEAQRRTDERLHELTERTDRRFQELAEAQRGLATAFGQLQASFGATIEEEAESVLQMVLEGKGYRLLAEPYSLVLDGEVDVVMELEAPTGERVWAVVEAKARLGHRQVRDWAQQIKSGGWQQRLVARGVTGPYLVYAYGIRVDPGAVRAAEEQGIGLVTGRGERVSPRELIRPSTDGE
jgi:prefoldin subunit 5